MMESNQRKLGAFLSYLSIIISTIVQLLYTPFLIRMLGQSEYGLYSLVSSVIGYLTVLDLGFGNAIVVFTAKYRANKEYEKEKKLHGMFLVIFCIIGLMLFGPKDIFAFDTAMLVGSIAGTYSSIFIAINIFLFFESKNLNKTPKDKKVYKDDVEEKLVKGVNC